MSSRISPPPARLSAPPFGWLQLYERHLHGRAACGRATALLWSALPNLKGKIAVTKQILERTARPKDFTACGNPPGCPIIGYAMASWMS